MNPFKMYINLMIIKLYKKLNYLYKKSVINLYNLINNNKSQINDDNDDNDNDDKLNDIELLCYGNYFNIVNNVDKMINCFLMAVDKGNTYAMNNLGLYYKNKGD